MGSKSLSASRGRPFLLTQNLPVTASSAPILPTLPNSSKSPPAGPCDSVSPTPGEPTADTPQALAPGDSVLLQELYPKTLQPKCTGPDNGGPYDPHGRQTPSTPPAGYTALSESEAPHDTDAQDHLWDLLQYCYGSILLLLVLPPGHSTTDPGFRWTFT